MAFAKEDTSKVVKKKVNGGFLAFLKRTGIAQGISEAAGQIVMAQPEKPIPIAPRARQAAIFGVPTPVAVGLGAALVIVVFILGGKK